MMPTANRGLLLKIKDLNYLFKKTNLRSLLTTPVVFDAETQVVKKPGMDKQLQNITSLQNAYMEKLNKQASEKRENEKRLRKHYRITGTILFTFVISVYIYSMYAVSQEKFLDDFDVPQPPNKTA